MKLLFTLGLVLCMSSIASSNECARDGHHSRCKSQAAECKREAATPKPDRSELSTLTMLNDYLYI